MPITEDLPSVLRRDNTEEKLVAICQKNDVVLLAVFGSFVRGEGRKRSDVDVLIKYRENSLKTLFDLVALQQKLRNVFRRKVDLVEIGGLTNPYIRQEVLKSMKVIYEER
ncbi:MAG: nucleotidyltransferase domain-containing protein [Chloroflexi bacterium]|nr:nucleotidyltransferase domain-containing protein [Chloroflexota bacterium]